MPRYVTCLAATVALTLAAGCTAGPAAPPEPTHTPVSTPAPLQPRTTMPADATTVVEGTEAAELALATSRVLFQHAPAAVLADGDEANLAGAAATAVELGVPLLLAPGSGEASELRAELDRLGARTVVAVGTKVATWAEGASPPLAGKIVAVSARTGTSPGAVSATPGATSPTPGAVSATPGAEASDDTDLPAGVVTLPEIVPAPPLSDLLILALDGPGSAAATATARASGARMLLLADPDPRTDGEAIAALAGQPVSRVLALGSAFGPAERLRRRIDTAATGVQLPGGGQVVFPGRRMIALYGHPGDPGLGSLGEQGLTGAIARARKVAASYSSLVDEPVVPAFEIITTVASSSAGADGNYSNEVPVSKLRPWVEAAGEAGIYVVLDLQPGRTDFLTQAKRYRELLVHPHVGLALDPEWRLKPGQRHMVQIGSVTAAEVNQTAAWLAELTREHKLPQKVLMLHQFRLDMIKDRASVKTSYDELRVVIHADGFGTAGQKFDTWRAMHVNPPAGVWWGWKNFYDEDRPTFTPKQTMAVKPKPVFVSYQ